MYIDVKKTIRYTLISQEIENINSVQSLLNDLIDEDDLECYFNKEKKISISELYDDLQTILECQDENLTIKE